MLLAYAFVTLAILAVLIFLHVKKSRLKPKALPDFTGVEGPHDCGIRALLKVMPDLDTDKVIETFTLCTDTWPHGGITDNEFNIGLRHLGVFHKFDYDSAPTTIGKLKSRKDDTCIALVPGHYTVVRKGLIVDSDSNNFMPDTNTVIGQWTLKLRN